MKYKCKVANLDKFIITHKGFVKSLCETCITLDCTNSIEKRKISVVGILKEMKVFSKGENVGFIISCEGYLTKD